MEIHNERKFKVVIVLYKNVVLKKKHNFWTENILLLVFAYLFYLMETQSLPWTYIYSGYNEFGLKGNLSTLHWIHFKLLTCNHLHTGSASMLPIVFNATHCLQGHLGYPTKLLFHSWESTYLQSASKMAAALLWCLFLLWAPHHSLYASALLKNGVGPFIWHFGFRIDVFEPVFLWVVKLKSNACNSNLCMAAMTIGELAKASLIFIVLCSHHFTFLCLFLFLTQFPNFSSTQILSLFPWYSPASRPKHTFMKSFVTNFLLQQFLFLFQIPV